MIEAKKRAELGRRRGVAIVTVMVLLTSVLYLVLALLVRSNSSFFTSGRHIASMQALYVADAAASEKMSVLIEQYWRTGDASVAVDWMRSTVSGDFPVYDARGGVAGYADVRYTLDDPHLPDRTGTFGGHSYVTVAVEAQGSPRDRSDPWRATRTVTIRYNLATPGLPADAFDFAYFMNHWVWFTDFGPGQAQIIGNAAANGNFDVLRTTARSSSYLTLVAGPGYVYGPTGVSYSSNPYTRLWLRSQNTGYDPTAYGIITGTVGTASTSRFGTIPTPRMLSATADEDGAIIRTAQTQRGSLRVKTVRITGTSPLAYTVQSVRTLTDCGVYGGTGSGQKESLVLAGSVSEAPRVGDILQVISVDGPVVVRGNLVLRGLIEGHGTLYAGRNLYIAGNLTYAHRTSCYPSSSTTTADHVPQPSAEDAACDKVAYCAAGSVVYGDITDRAAWLTIMDWFAYVDPQTGERVNDNHEDAGLDGIVDSKGFDPTDTREGDGHWTVELRSTTTGEVRLADLPVVDEQAQVPSGWSVVEGSGEDADGDGRYTPPYDYARDFMFASRPDASGAWSPLSFSAAGFDECPGVTYAAFCSPVTRVDGFVLANKAIAGWLGDNASNVVFYGGEAGRQECMATRLNGHCELIWQDTRFSQVNDIGAPSAVRTSFAQWCGR